MEQIETEGWKSKVVGKGPFRAELGVGCNGWWIVVNANGEHIDESADGGFFESSAKMIADGLNQQARIEELVAFAQLVIEELDVAALDDCESGVASVNAKLAGQYLNDYRHTREATYKLRGKAAKILEGTNDE